MQGLANWLSSAPPGSTEDNPRTSRARIIIGALEYIFFPLFVALPICATAIIVVYALFASEQRCKVCLYSRFHNHLPSTLACVERSACMPQRGYGTAHLRSRVDLCRRSCMCWRAMRRLSIPVTQQRNLCRCPSGCKVMSISPSTGALQTHIRTKLSSRPSFERTPANQSLP
jgi:hypothetical protein